MNNRQTSKKKTNNVAVAAAERRGGGAGGGVKDLARQEEEFKRLNEELEAKSATLVEQADAVLRGQASLLDSRSTSARSLLDQVDHTDLVYDSDQEQIGGHTVGGGRRVDEMKSERDGGTVGDREKMKGGVGPRVGKQRVGRPSSATSTARRGANSRTATTMANGANGAAAYEYEYENSLDIDFQQAIANAHRFINNDNDGEYTSSRVMAADRTTAGVTAADDDVMPPAAGDMSTEAQIRFLKAKLRVLQEEIDRLTTELSSKEEQLKKSQVSVKELQEERGKLERKAAAQQTQADRYKKTCEDTKNRTEDLEHQLSAARKEIESLKRDQKQQALSHSGLEVRLNRALEEVDRYKSQVERVKTTGRDGCEEDRQRVQQLTTDNRRLEKQKNELMTAFKKQLKLVDVLKRQKLHLEAARMLSFTEEEFIRSLDWGTTTGSGN